MSSARMTPDKGSVGPLYTHIRIPPQSKPVTGPSPGRMCSHAPCADCCMLAGGDDDHAAADRPHFEFGNKRGTKRGSGKTICRRERGLLKIARARLIFLLTSMSPARRHLASLRLRLGFTTAPRIRDCGLIDPHGFALRRVCGGESLLGCCWAAKEHAMMWECDGGNCGGADCSGE